MRFEALIAVALLVPRFSARAQAGPSPDSIRRLPPTAFWFLPGLIRRDLGRRGCIVPQPWDARQPKNIIHGSFTAVGVTEWAVLCSVRDTSQILVYRVASGRTVRIVDSLLPAPDRAWMQGIGGDRWGYSRLLLTLPRRTIGAWRTDVDRRAIPQPVNHDAIEQIFLGKGAEGFYYARRWWYRQITAD